jgi:hypothetical protein
MNRTQKQLCVVALMLAVGGAGMMVGRVARSEEEALFATYATSGLKHPYRHNSHFMATIELPAAAATANPPYKFSSTTKVSPAVFYDSTNKATNTEWVVYSHTPSMDGKRMSIIFLAQHPKGPTSDDVPGGTGTIQVSTSEPCCTPTTTSPTLSTTMGSINVAPIDGAQTYP